MFSVHTGSKKTCSKLITSNEKNWRDARCLWITLRSPINWSVTTFLREDDGTSRQKWERERETDSNEEDIFSNGSSTRHSQLEKNNIAKERPLLTSFDFFFGFNFVVVVAVAVVDAQAFLKGRGNTALPRHADKQTNKHLIKWWIINSEEK